MPRGVRLSKQMQKIILHLREKGKTIREIAEIVEISKTSVNKFITNPKDYNIERKRGRPACVSDRDMRRIKQLAVNKNVSARQIKSELSLNITPRRIQQILSADMNIRYENMEHKPKLNARHKRARLEFAEKYKFWTNQWTNVIFSDEKKFNLDGPDGQRKYWRDRRRERRSCYRRNFGGGSLMVWAAFGHHGKSPICFISHRMNSQMYTSLLDNVLIEFSESFWGENFVFQQDNAAIHVSKMTKDFFKDKQIELLEWPACSPDLNPIENVWGLLSYNVYLNGRQYETLADLKKAIVEEWRKIDLNTLQRLVQSMPNRLGEVINKGGGSTHY